MQPRWVHIPTSTPYSGFSERCQLTAYGGCWSSLDWGSANWDSSFDLEGFEAAEACDWSPESACHARLARPAGPAGFCLHQDRLDHPLRALRHPDSFERSAEPKLPMRQPRPLQPL